MLQYEDIYKSLLMQYDKDAVQKTHRLIGLFLVDNQEVLGIRETEKVQTRNFHGNDTVVQCWTRILTDRKNNRVAQCVLFLLILLLPFQVLADGWRYGTKTQRTLALQNFDEQIKGWEWIIMDAAKFERTTYPYEMGYYTYHSHPDYVIKTENYGIGVFDPNGSLVRIAHFDPMGRISYGDLTIDHNEGIRQYQEEVINEYKADIMPQILRKLLPKDYCIVQYQSTPLKMRLYNDGYNILGYKNIKANTGKNFSRVNSFTTVEDPRGGKFSGSFICLIAKGPQSEQEIYYQLQDGVEKFHYQFELKEKELAIIESAVNSANAGSSQFVIRTLVQNADDKGKNKYVAIVPKFNDREILNERRINVKPSDLVTEDLTYESYIINECRAALLSNLMKTDYLGNKYNVQSEPEEVRNNIEEKLGLRTKSQEKKVDEDIENNPFLLRVCQRIGITYRKGMTDKEFQDALRKRYPNWTDEQIAAKVVRVMEEEQQRALEDALLLAAVTSSSSNSSAKRADRYINQLKYDHEQDTQEMKTVTRIDDTTFDVVFATGKVVRVSFYSDEPFKCKYRINIQE